MADESEGTRVFIAPCEKCATDTRHELLHENDERANEDDTWWQQIDRLLRCAGCREICLQRTFYRSEYLDADGKPVAEVAYFPTRPTRSSPKWLAQLPADLQGLL